jgi:hypothetical protein
MRGLSVLPVVIRGLDGEELAVAVPVVNPAEPLLTFTDVVSGKGRLLADYFQDHLRSVIVDCGEFQLRGALSTRWIENHRVWAVELRSPSRGEISSTLHATAIEAPCRAYGTGATLSRPASRRTACSGVSA